jgi:hypothetical protein
MRADPKYLEHHPGSISSYVILMAIAWTFIVPFSFLFIIDHSTTESPSVMPTPHVMSPWVSSTAQKIERTRTLTLHLARDYKTVEFLADTSETGDELSGYWNAFKEQHPYITQIGVVEEDTSDHFYVGRYVRESPSISTGSEELINYWMQVGLLKNNDILFFDFSEVGQGVFFRFTTPVHYEDMRLGHLYIDVDVDQLLLHTALELSSQAMDSSIVMLDQEGNYVSELTDNHWSAKKAFEQSIGYYYPEFWLGMNARLSGQFSTATQTTYFSKLDIPWYENQIKYFYLVQISPKAASPLPETTLWQPAVFIWLIGLLGLGLLHQLIRKQRPY